MTCENAIHEAGVTENAIMYEVTLASAPHWFFEWVKDKPKALCDDCGEAIIYWADIHLWNSKEHRNG